MSFTRLHFGASWPTFLRRQKISFCQMKRKNRGVQRGLARPLRVWVQRKKGSSLQIRIRQSDKKLFLFVEIILYASKYQDENLSCLRSCLTSVVLWVKLRNGDLYYWAIELKLLVNHQRAPAFRLNSQGEADWIWRTTNIHLEHVYLPHLKVYVS